MTRRGSILHRGPMLIRNRDPRGRSDASVAAAPRRRAPGAEPLRNGVRALIALGAVLLGPSIGLAQEEPDTAAEVVAIRFDWPVGLRAEVTASRQRERETEGKVSGFNIASEYRFEVSDHDAGLLVNLTDFRISDISADPGVADFFANAMNQFAGISPDYIVSREGELLQLVGLDEIVAASRALLGPMLDSLKTMSPEAASLVESMLSESYFMSQAAEEWNAAVGLWLDADFEVGAVYVLEQEEPSPVLPDVLIPFYYEFSLSDHAPCHDSAAPRSCVVLEMVSFPDADAVKSLLSDIMQRIAGREIVGQFYFEELEVENTVRLVTEPATLIPHSVELVKWIRGTMAGPAGAGGEFRQIERRSYSYRYADR